jgi:hypothetical protein
MTVRGTCSDASTIVSVSVNGVEATSSDDFVNWQVEVSVASGLNDYVVSASDSKGNTDSGAASVSVESSGFLWGLPTKMDFDPVTGRLYVLDSMLDSIVQVDLASGHRTLLAGPPSDGYFGMSKWTQDVAFDPAFNRALIVDSRPAAKSVIVGVDLITGQRTLLSGNGVGSGPSLPKMYNVSVAADGLTAYVVAQDTLLEVDLNTGDRTILSDPSTGSGPTFSYGAAAHLDEGGNRMLIADRLLDQLFAVDLTSGDRTLLSDETVGTADPITYPVDVGYDPIADRAYLAEYGKDFGSPSGLMGVDLVTGEQTMVSDESTGAGILLAKPAAVEWDALGGRAIVLNTDGNCLVSVDAVSGDRSSITDISVGSGSQQVGGGAIALDPVNHRLICSDGDGLLAVDLLTGDRSVFMDMSLLLGDGIYHLAYSTSSGKAYFDDSDWGMICVFDPVAGTVEILNTQNETAGMVVDEAAGALLAIQGNRLVSIDMTTGTATMISDESTGSGPAFSNLFGLAVNAARTVAWTVDSDLEALFRVDLATGARTIVADPTTGTGETLEDVGGLAVDEARGEAYLTLARGYGSSDPSGILIVDLATGDRALMDQESDASRSPLAFPGYIVRDGSTGLLYLNASQAIVVVDPITGCNGVRSAAQ